MKVLIDTNIILDLVLDRQPYSIEAKNIWDANSTGLYEGYLSAITPINVHYFVRKFKGAELADQVVQELLDNFKICPLDQLVLQAAKTSPIKDYEDAVQHSSAENSGLTAIVTRNTKDYVQATVTVFSPSDFLHHLSGSSGLPQP
jgi:predicted nucleic acid-binding protein